MQERQGRSQPEPFASQVARRNPLVKKPTREARDEKRHAVFAQHPEADRRADRQPPAWITAPAKAGHEVSHRHPGQIIKRDILHQAAGREGKRHRGANGEQLGAATAPQFARDQTGEDDCDRTRERSKKPKPGERSAEEMERHPAEKRRDRRISHVTPGEMTRIIERRQFIAMKTVAPACEPMRHNRRCRDRDQQPEIGAPALGWMLQERRDRSCVS